MLENDKQLEAILDRVAQVTESISDVQLANHLKVTRQVLSKWRKRGTIPYEKLIEFARSKELSVDWLLYGHLEDLDQPDPIVVRNLGTLIGLSFKKQGAAIVAISYGEISRVIKACLEYEKTKKPRNTEILASLKTLSEYFIAEQIENELAPEILIETVISQLGVKLTPLFPDDKLMKLLPYESPLMKQIRKNINDEAHDYDEE